MYRGDHPASAPETARHTTLDPRTPQLKMSNFSQEQLSPATKADELLGGDDWEMVSQSSDKAETLLAGTGQHQLQVPRPQAPSAASGRLTYKALEELQAAFAPVLGQPSNVGQWAQSQSSHGDSLNAARPQEGMPPTNRVGHKAAEAERPRDHPKSPSSSRPSTNASEGFTPAGPLNQVDVDLRCAGARFDEPTPYLATMLSLEELDLLLKKAPESRTGKSRK